MRSWFPTSIQGWMIAYLFWLTVAVLIVWAATKADMPQGVQNVLSMVIGGFLGFLTGKKTEDPPPGSTIETTSAVTTPKEES